MMPGENHSQAAGIASDATAGTCQNCNALQQNLNEYVATLLALKQKIIDTDHLLMEYQEKCDELQKAQRETSSLHHQLDELFLKLTPLEKQNEEFEAMKSELEEKRSSLKLCQQTLLESESLKEEIRKTESVKKQLEDKVKKLEDAGEKQGQELKQLKMEKNMLEKELDKTQSSLKLCQQMRLDYENQKEEISKTESVKKQLEDKVKKLEETRASQSQEIKQLKMEKNMLEKDLQKTQFNLEKLEEENRQKDVRSASVQTNTPEETGVKIDQTKVRMLLQELWMCLEPSSQISQSTDRQHFPFKETGLHRRTSNPHPCVQPTLSKSPLKHQNQNNQPLFHRSPSEDLQCYEPIRFQSNSSKSPVLPVPESAGTMHKKGKRKRKRYSGKSEEDVHIEAVVSEESKELTVNDNVNEQLKFLSNEEKERSPLIRGDIEEVLECFKPLPPVLSPLNLSLPNSEDSLFGYMSDSSDEEKGVRFCDVTKEKDKTLSEKSDPSCIKEYYEGEIPSSLPKSGHEHPTQNAGLSLGNNLTVSPTVPQISDETVPCGSLDICNEYHTSGHKDNGSNLLSPECQQINTENLTFSVPTEETRYPEVPSHKEASQCSVLENEEPKQNNGKLNSLQCEKDIVDECPVSLPDCLVKDSLSEEHLSPNDTENSNTEYMEIEQSKQEVSEMDTECSLAGETEIHKKQPSSPLCTAERKLQETDKTDIVCSIRDDREVCSAQDMLFQTAPANADCKEKESTGSCSRVSVKLQEHSETEEQFTKYNTTEQEPESETEQTVLKDSADGSLPKHESLGELNSCEESCKKVNSEHTEEERFVDYLKVQTSASDSTKNIISPQNNSSLSDDEMEQTKRKITVDVMENCHVLQKRETTEPSVKQNIDTLIESAPSSDITQCVKGEMMSTDKGTVEGPLCGLPVDSDKGLCEFQETESEKISELDSSKPESLQHDAECPRGTDRGVPLGSDLSILDEHSSAQNLFKDADNADKEAINQTCSNGNPNVSKNDMSSVEQKVKDEKIMKESRLNDSLEETDSSDDQEGCILQRKVKTSQRAESHDSNEKANTVLHSHQDFTKLEDPLPEDVKVTSNESESQSISVMSKNTFPSLGDNFDIQQCVSTGGINTDVPKGNEQVDESEPESTLKISGKCLFDNDIKTSNDCEVTGDEKDLNESKGGLANILLESRNITEENNLSSGIPKLPSQSVLESESDTHHGYEKCNESALCKVTEAVFVNAPECINRNGEIAKPEVCPLSAVKTVTSNDSAVPDCTRPQPFSAEDGVKRKIIHADPPAQATADTPLSPKPSPESIKKVRSKMGPPLPPLLQPLPATPPASRKRLSPSKSSSSRLFCPSPVDEQVSSVKEKPATSITSPLSNEPNNSPFWATPSPSDVCKSRVVSSPLQFCATTPKHALPVPGRLPPSALASSTSSNLPQENSVRILDSMYPELSARAITLNILRGNVCLNRGMPGTGNAAPRSANQISGFKSINSSTTAFTKTGKACESEGSSFQHPSDNSEICDSGLLGKPKQAGKRVSVLLPRSAKRLRLDNDSPVPEKTILPFPSCENSTELLDGESRLRNQGQNLQSVEKEADVKKIPSHNPPEAILNALKKIENTCFDLLPVIRSHIHVGKIPQVPVLRDEEREVIHGFCVVNKHLAEDLLSSILTKMKSEKNTLESNHLQALCRVYVGICRQQGDLERARVFAYSILKEDFPDSAKMILFITATWSNIFSFPGLINKSIQALAKQRAEGEVLQCLTAYLGWEKSPPCDIIKLLSSTLIVLQMGVNMKFQDNERHGEDLSPCVWEYVFALELLCSHQNWTWIHDIFLSRELWPIMDKWVKQGPVVKHIHDITVAAVLRLIGRVGQMGLRQRAVVSVKNVAKVINTFCRHANAEGVPWGVQLAAVYAIYDLAPSNPKEALEALAAWREATTRPVPPAVTSCIMQIGFMLRQMK
ncbi:little elongation complex subunit 1 isoform X1 [Lepisosteus oculatus]|uniref:little elongation complex subunit 1 isoform X1 n=1 Tax=Lepisosteus oculatus TaxID=7918 RepID=UPI0035F4FF04